MRSRDRGANHEIMQVVVPRCQALGLYLGSKVGELDSGRSIVISSSDIATQGKSRIPA